MHFYVETENTPGFASNIYHMKCMCTTSQSKRLYPELQQTMCLEDPSLAFHSKTYILPKCPFMLQEAPTKAAFSSSLLLSGHLKHLFSSQDVFVYCLGLSLSHSCPCVPVYFSLGTYKQLFSILCFPEISHQLSSSCSYVYHRKCLNQ